ncbi:hypothetical protein A3A74_06345 [Candidatus Roizmanbacteria bacterium RIFCSPLOWO2_01_FULL_35_13]|uniref:Uncharacterized protein n=1 Tax=Candidatus Roizmanbacteria bacterium RIFCSPLOWO2_01_FULL_35_13 TaxID=1802055 RepID=A0A1F7IH03_9BACT|nr:MAG: hypothetical protein A3A74_06345 [Candidatus Roizmanbacteria bacterium RIFCSPLOWO2_01_FULL_35_13]
MILRYTQDHIEFNRNMNKYDLLQRFKKYKEDRKFINMKDSSNFFRRELGQLLRRKLEVPVKVYHL